jgi:hypothetical protein
MGIKKANYGDKVIRSEAPKSKPLQNIKKSIRRMKQK